MVEVVTLRSFTVQIIFSPFLWLGNPVTIHTTFSTWAENGQNCYLLWQVVTCFVFSCDKMWFLVLSDELRLHMVHNYINIYVSLVPKKWDTDVCNLRHQLIRFHFCTRTIRTPHSGFETYTNPFPCHICLLVSTQYIEYSHNKTQLELWHFLFNEIPILTPPQTLILLESWDFQLSNDRGLGVADRVFLMK
jgi:hypothetical protein